ncbi:MAG: DUF853 family protein [Clostridia bacterium]|nr:DUF853 family protein [Clostridia bacterium]
MFCSENGKIWMATGEERVYLEPAMANRHGLIAGATGTGKTVTLKVVAESFSEAGVPTFIADIKGDLTGMCFPGEENKHIRRSIDTMGLGDFEYRAYPVRFFDVYARRGHPVRTTISEMGPELLSRLLGLTDVQSGVLRIIFRIADEKGLLLLDLKDLRSMVQYVGDNAGEYKLTYGNITSQSVGAIQRALLTLEDEGGDVFFGEPALELEDWFDWSDDGRGVMNILECQTLFQHPLLYSTFLLWMLSELYELLPEAGDLERPKIAFFFDEAHLLFRDAPRALVEKIEQIVRLIRSKGVSVWFITQNPADIPESVLGQIGNRVQHALRAYTPNEQKALKYAAMSFRANPSFDTESALQELAVGEALVSVLDEKGTPTVVERAGILPPRSSMNAVDDAALRSVIISDPLCEKYTAIVDRESAYEKISAERERAEEEAAAAAEEAEKKREEEKRQKEKEAARKKSSSSRKTSAVGRAASSAANSFGRELGREIFRGIFGTYKR